MTTIGQVWHLVKKDATQLRWWLLGYLVLSVMATLTATQIVENEWGGSTTIFAPSLWLLGGVIAALLVQADAPVNPRAFWASQPIPTRAVLMAKLSLSVVLLLMPPLLGELLALRYFGITGTEFGSLMLHSVWLYSAWLLIAMLVASLTKRFAGFVATVIGVPVAFTIVAITLDDWSGQLDMAWVPRALLQLLATAGSAVLLTLVYRKRRAGRPMLGAAAVMFAAGMLAVTRPAARAERPTLDAANAPSIELDVVSFDAERLRRNRELFVQLTAKGMRAPYRYALLTDSTAATWTDGANTPLWAPLFMNDVPKLFGGPGAGSELGTVAVMLPRSSAAKPRTGTVTSFRIFGAVETLTAERVLQMEPTGRAERRDGDVRVRFAGGEADGAGVSLQMLTVYRAGVHVRDLFALRRRYTAQLVWPDRADTVELAMGNVSDEDRMMVLPGASVHRVSIRQNSDGPSRDSLPAPLAEASLELIRWTPVARRPIVVTRTVP